MSARVIATLGHCDHCPLQPNEFCNLVCMVVKQEKTAKDIIRERWYWVRRENGEWFPAIWDGVSGWCNSDTWWDTRGEIVEYKLIPLPDEMS
jgi:putative heme iron utilization protein